MEEPLPPTSFYNMLILMFGFHYRELEEDVSRLEAILVSILIDMGGKGVALLVDLINKVYHFGAGESHIITSIIASQEAIKVKFK